MRRPAVYGKQRGGFSVVAAMHPVSPPAQSICLQGGISYVISLPFAVSRRPPLAAVLNAVHRHRPVRLYPCDGVCAYLGVRAGGAGAGILPTGCRTDSGGGLPCWSIIPAAFIPMPQRRWTRCWASPTPGCAAFGAGWELSKPFNNPHKTSPVVSENNGARLLFVYFFSVQTDCYIMQRRIRPFPAAPHACPAPQYAHPA